MEDRKIDNKESKVKMMLSDTKAGFMYLWSEKGLFFIALYFLFSSFGGGVSNVSLLPYMKETMPNGEYYYLIIGGMMMLGRVVTSSWHYRHKLPIDKKFLIAFLVYIFISIIEGSLLFLPLIMMFTLSFFSGCLGVTSYTIRISATQSYVPDEKKGRFNGAFNMLSVLGALIGEGVAGVLSTFMDMRFVMLTTQMIVLLSAVFIMGGKRRYIAPIYNREQ